MPDAPTPDPATPSPVAADAPLELLPGTADLLVLQTLVWGPRHRFAVASWVRRRTAGVPRRHQLTPGGRARLGAEASARRRYAAAVFRVLDPAPVGIPDRAPGA